MQWNQTTGLHSSKLLISSAQDGDYRQYMLPPIGKPVLQRFYESVVEDGKWSNNVFARGTDVGKETNYRDLKEKKYIVTTALEVDRIYQVELQGKSRVERKDFFATTKSTNIFTLHRIYSQCHDCHHFLARST